MSHSTALCSMLYRAWRMLQIGTKATCTHLWMSRVRISASLTSKLPAVSTQLNIINCLLAKVTLTCPSSPDTLSQSLGSLGPDPVWEFVPANTLIAKPGMGVCVSRYAHRQTGYGGLCQHTCSSPNPVWGFVSADMLTTKPGMGVCASRYAHRQTGYGFPHDDYRRLSPHQLHQNGMMSCPVWTTSP